MLTTLKNRFDTTLYLNYILIGYALCLPLSKAGINLFESLAILFWLIEGRWKEKFSLIKKNLLAISIILLIAMSLIASLWSVSFEHALDYVGKYRHFIIIFIILTSLKKEYIKHVLIAFLIGMFISEIISYGIFFEIFTRDGVSPTNPTPFMSHTDYSVYLAFTAVTLLILFINKESKKLKGFYLFFSLLSIGNLFLLAGRTGQVIFVILIILFFFYSVKNKFKAFIISTVVLAIILSLAYNISNKFHSRVNHTISDVKDIYYNNNYNGSFGQRIALWIVGIDKFQDNFLLGTGIGNEMEGSVEYLEKRNIKNSFGLQVFADHHNNFITLMIQLGVMGLIIGFLIFYSVFRLKFESTKYHLINRVFFIAFFFWTMIGITLHIFFPMVFFALFAGLLNKISYLEQIESEKS